MRRAAWRARKEPAERKRGGGRECWRCVEAVRLGARNTSGVPKMVASAVRGGAPVSNREKRKKILWVYLDAKRKKPGGFL